MNLSSRSSTKLLLLTILSLLLVACGGLSAESAKGRVLTSEDFDFEVKVNSQPSALELEDIFEGDCSDLDAAISDFSKSKFIAGAEFEERSEAQNGFSLGEFVVEFSTSEEADGFISKVEKIARNSDCEWFFSNSSSGANGSAVGFGSEDFGNVRNLQTAFKVDVEKSVVLDIDSQMVISGTFLSTSSSEEGGAAFAASGNFVIIVHYSVQADDINSSASPVTRSDLEKIVSTAYKKMIG